MSKKLTRDEIIHLIKNLSALDVSDEKITIYQAQLSDILNYVKSLQKIDTSKVTAISQINGLENILRKDEIIAGDASPTDILNCNPLKVINNQIVVPHILK